MAEIGKIPTLEGFQAEIKKMFGAYGGMHIHFEQLEENILRAGFKVRGMPELVLDLRAGPVTRFGQSIFEVTSQGSERWMYYYGPESVGIGKELQFFGAGEAFANYVRGALYRSKEGQVLPGTERMTPEERMAYLRTYGYYNPKVQYRAAGGVMNINPQNHISDQIKSILESVTISAPERWQVTQAVDQLFAAGNEQRRLMAGGQYRPRPFTTAAYLSIVPELMQAATGGERGRLVAIPGTVSYDAQGRAVISGVSAYGGTAEERAAMIAKREALYQREPNVQFIEYTSAGKLRIAEPAYITEVGAQGWVHPNLMVSGKEVPPIYLQQRVLQTPGMPSGSMIIRREAWDILEKSRIISGGLRQGIRLDFPEVSPRELSRATIIPGIFKEAAEGQYQKVEELTGRAIPAETTEIVGLLSWTRSGKEITKPIRITTEAMPFYVPEGEEFGLHMYMPPSYLKATGEPTGFSGRGVMSTKVIADLLEKRAGENGLTVHRTTKEGIYLNLEGMAGVGVSLKSPIGGTKIAPAFQAAIPGIQTLTTTVPGATHPEQIWALTSDVKLVTEWFQWSVFAGMPNVKQEQMLRELSNADASKTQAVNAMIGYIKGLEPKPGTTTKIPDVTELGAIYAKYTNKNTPNPGFTLMEDLRQAVMNIKDPATSMERYQVALLPPTWLKVGEVHKSLVEFMEHEYEATWGINWRKFAQLTPIEGRPGYFMEQRYGMGVLGPLGSALTAEFMSNNPRINMAGMRSIDPIIAAGLNIAPGMNVSETGMQPPAVRAWSGLVDAVGWWRSKMTGRASYRDVNALYPEPYRIATSDEIRATGLLTWINRKTSPREITEFLEKPENLGYAPEMIVLPSGEIFPGSRLIDKLATYKYGMEEGLTEAISRIGRQYPTALAAAINLETAQSLRPIRNPAASYMADIERITTEGKDVFKLTTSGWPEVVSGGRYSYVGGVPLNVGIISQQVLETALARKAKTLGIKRADMQEWRANVLSQMREMGGIPSLAIREPNVWERGGAVPAMLVTPQILREQYGLDFPEGTNVYGKFNQRIIAGNPLFTGVLGALGMMTVGQQGDWDFDQMLTIMGIKITRKGIKPTKGMLAAAKMESGRQTDLLYKSIIDSFGSQTKSSDVVIKALEDLGVTLDANGLPVSKPLLGYQIDETGRIVTAIGPEPAFGETVQEESMLRAVSKRGMAFAHTLRTWFASGGISLALSDDVIRKGVIGMAGPYQKYLDYATKEIRERGGGFSAIETLFTTAVHSYERATGELSIYAMTGADQPFRKVASTYAVELPGGKGVQPSDMSNFSVVETLVWTLQKSGYTNDTMAFLLGQTQAMREEISTKLKKGIPLANIMLPGTVGNIWQSKGGYDITQTPIGITFFTGVFRKDVRTGKEKVIQVWNEVTGEMEEIPISQAARNVPIMWQGKIMAYGELLHDPVFETASMLIQALTNQGGPLTPEQYARAGRLKRRLEAEGIEPPQQLLQIVARGPTTEAVEEALSKRLSIPEVMDRLVNRIINYNRQGVASNMRPMRIRASALPYFAVETYEEAGSVYGSDEQGRGKATWEEIRDEQRLKLFMSRYLNVSQEDMDKVFPVTSSVPAAGKAFERRYVTEKRAEWSGAGRRPVLTDIEYKAGGTTYVSMKQLARWEPISEIFSTLIEKYPEIEKWEISGIPDVLRLDEITETGVIEEVKQINKGIALRKEDEEAMRERTLMRGRAASNQVRIQLAAYLLGGLATAAAGWKQFYKWVDPLIKASAEYTSLPAEEQFQFWRKTRTKLWKAFRQGAEGIETVNVRGGIIPPESARITQEDLMGLATLVSKGMERAYTMFNTPEEIKPMLVKAIEKLRDANIELSPDIQRLVDEFPIEAGMPAKVKPRAVPNVRGARGRGKEREISALPTFEEPKGAPGSLERQAYDMYIQYVSKAPNAANVTIQVAKAIEEVEALQAAGLLQYPQKALEAAGVFSLAEHGEMSYLEAWKEAEGQQKARALRGIESRKMGIPTTKEISQAYSHVVSALGAAGRAGTRVEPGDRAKLESWVEGSDIGGTGQALRFGTILSGLLPHLETMSKSVAEINKNFADTTTRINKWTESVGEYTKKLGELPRGTEEFAEAEKGFLISKAQQKLAWAQARKLVATKVASEITPGTTPEEQQANALAMLGAGAEYDKGTREEAAARKELAGYGVTGGEEGGGGEYAQPGGAAGGIGKGPSGPTRLSRMFRRFIGGWGIFYMGALASWPARAMGYGLEQQEQFAAQGAAYAAGQFGVGAVTPYEALAYDVQRAQIGANAGGMAAFQRMGANVPGVARQFGGVLMGGVAGAAFANFALSAAVPAFFNEATAAAIGGPITFGAALVGMAAATSLNIAGNLQNPQGATMSAAADITRYGAGWGALSNWWNVTMPQQIKERLTPAEQAELTGYYNRTTGASFGGEPLSAAEMDRKNYLEKKERQVPDIFELPYNIAASSMQELGRQFLGRPPTAGAEAERAAIANMVGLQREQGRIPYAAQAPFIAQNLIQEAVFKPYAPEIVQQTAIRMMAGGAGFQANTEALMLEQVRAQSVGINIQAAGQLITAVARQPYTAANAQRAEQWAARNIRDMYQDIRYQEAWQWMRQAPASYVRQTMGPVSWDQTPVAGMAPNGVPGIQWTAPVSQFAMTTEIAANLQISPAAGTWEAGASLASQAQAAGYQWQAPSFQGDMNEQRRFEAMVQIQRGGKGEAAFEQLGMWGFARPAAQIIADRALRGELGATELTRFMTTMGAFAQAGIPPASMAPLTMNYIRGYDERGRRTTVRERGLAEEGERFMTVQGAYWGQMLATVEGAFQRALGPEQGLAAFNRLQRPGEALSTIEGTRMAANLFAGSPYAWTAAAQVIPNTEMVNVGGQMRPWNLIAARGDINLQGFQTGMEWGTTSLQRGILGTGGYTGQQMANMIWGAGRWEGSPAARAMVEGVQTPSGRTVGGTMGFAWQQANASYEYQMQMAGISGAQVALSREYAPQFFALQTQQAQLGYNQQQANFAYQQATLGLQQQQFALQGVQFQQQMGLQQRGMQMQRGYTREDWAYQGQVREMQWGWRQEDFQEQARFMTGRERRLAERQMGRETIMYGMEGEQIEKQKKRQEEMWKLEDERFNLQKKHFLENRKLQEESMQLQQNQLNLQKRYYEEGYQLQEKYRNLQYEFQMKQLDLAAAAAGAQAAFAKAQKDANDKMMEFQQFVLELQAAWILLQDEPEKLEKLQADLFDKYGSGIIDLTTLAGALQSAIANIKVPDFGTQMNVPCPNGCGWSGKISEVSNHLKNCPGKSTPSPSPVTVFYYCSNCNASFTSASARDAHQRGCKVVEPTDSTSSPSNTAWKNIVGNKGLANFSSDEKALAAGTIVLVLNIGNERLGRYILRTVSQELEV